MIIVRKATSQRKVNVPRKKSDPESDQSESDGKEECDEKESDGQEDSDERESNTRNSSSEGFIQDDYKLPRCSSRFKIQKSYKGIPELRIQRGHPHTKKLFINNEAKKDNRFILSGSDSESKDQKVRKRFVKNHIISSEADMEETEVEGRGRRRSAGKC